MARAGLQRTCPQRPHGGYETLSLRSELKARSCQRLQGRKGLPAPPALPCTHPWGGLCRGLSGGDERDHLVFLYLPSTTHGSSSDSGRPGAEQPSSEQSRQSGVPGLSRKTRDTEEEEPNQWVLGHSNLLFKNRCTKPDLCFMIQMYRALYQSAQQP